MGGALLPVTGLGIAYRSGRLGQWAAKAARWWDDVQMLHQTGIWGGTIRQMAKGLGDGELLFLRTRSIAAGVWELAWKHHGWPVPKPSLSEAVELGKLRWGIVDTGLRKMEARKDILDLAIEKGRRFIAHSDNDLQAIVRNGQLVLNADAAKVVQNVNDIVHGPMLRHTDVLTGLANKITGANPDDLRRTTVMIDHLGNVEKYSSTWKAFWNQLPDEAFHHISQLVTDFEFPR